MTFNNHATTKWRVFFWGLLALTFLLSHRYQADPTGESIESPDKMLHFVAFGAITFLFIGTRYIKSTLFLFLLATGWVIIDEWTQHLFPNNRTWSTADVVSGELGVLAAMCWKGACSSPKLQPLRDSFDEMLNSWHMWMMLGVVGFTSMCISFLAVWHIFNLFVDSPSTSLTMLISILVSTLMVLLYLIRNETVHSILYPLLKSMALPSLASIGLLPVFYLLFAPMTPIPFVIALACLVAWHRLVWDTKVFTLRELSVDL